ncbi:MAG: potassium-transporting ATPase subunit KdpC [Pirellulales bacterium]
MNSYTLYQSLKNAVVMLLLFTMLTGLVYPLSTTLVAQLLFPKQANGSLIQVDNTVVGSSLVGQQFNQEKYFWGRLSATTPVPYNAAASSGSNLGPSNSKLVENVQARIDSLQNSSSETLGEIPIDLVTASGSGLDPDISPDAARVQITRIARVRNLPEEAVERLVQQHTQGPQFGVLGEARVNVPQLNLALDQLQP